MQRRFERNTVPAPMRLLAAVDGMITEDAGRGLAAVVVDLADPSSLPGAVAAVTDPADPQQVKQAIDGVYHATVPDYLVLLGAPDVVPHQSLVNPMADDGDPDVPSDLPYACEHGYSTVIADFIGPTRVIGTNPRRHWRHGSEVPGRSSARAERMGADQQRVRTRSTFRDLSRGVGWFDDAQPAARVRGPDRSARVAERRAELVRRAARPVLALHQLPRRASDPHFYGQRATTTRSHTTPPPLRRATFTA